MTDPLINIFLIEPNDNLAYETMLVFCDSAGDARAAADAFELGKPKGEAPLPPSIYLNETLSTCKKIDPESIRHIGKDEVLIQYLGNKYHLTRGDAEVINRQ